MPFLKTVSVQISTLGVFWQEKVNNHIFRWNIVFIVAQLALLIFKFNNLPIKVPLYYSLPWGESQLTSASALFILPSFSIIFLLIDNLLATFFFKTIPLLSRTLIFISLVFSVFSFTTLLKIINLIS